MAKILLIDDDADLAETLKEVFEFEKHSVDCAETAEAALELLRLQKYDLVLCDWQLPDMDGVDICKQFRSAGGSTRILMLSGVRDAESRALAQQHGANDFLTKPFTVDDLLMRVKQNLQCVVPD
jgi:DNA-binding response OmpR family regulator